MLKVSDARHGISIALHSERAPRLVSPALRSAAGLQRRRGRERGRVPQALNASRNCWTRSAEFPLALSGHGANSYDHHCERDATCQVGAWHRPIKPACDMFNEIFTPWQRLAQDKIAWDAMEVIAAQQRTRVTRELGAEPRGQRMISDTPP